MRRVIVHIDRLVLTGFRQEDRDAVAAGLQDELGRVFTDRDAASRVGAMSDVPRLQIGGVRIDHGAGARGIGESVAQHIGREIKK
jgi:hypothetical protein